MYYLVVYLTNDRRAACLAAVCFAFCPYVFAHTSHVQLMMTFGLPFSMLAFHRVADARTAGRGAILGVTLTAQAVACGYYGVFVVLIVGVAVLTVASIRRLWLDVRYWTAIGVAAAVALGTVMPVLIPYVELQRIGFSRSLEQADLYSAAWSTYLASSAYAHAWMLPHLPPWKEVAFPGFVATGLGVLGLWCGRRVRSAEVTSVYGIIAVLALWASFGPRAGLYTLLYNTIPIFSLLRASQRFALVVDFSLCVLAGTAAASLLARLRNGTAVAAALVLVAIGELAVPLDMPKAPPLDPAYHVLAGLPSGALIEMPFYYPEVGLYQHANYMLASTSHWRPLVNGYSDYIPSDFYENVMTLAAFPSYPALKILERQHVRYAMFHMYGYNGENRRDVLDRLKQFAPYVRPVYTTPTTRLYEITGYPR
jgi:hypothetical protein